MSTPWSDVPVRHAWGVRAGWVAAAGVALGSAGCSGTPAAPASPEVRAPVAATAAVAQAVRQGATTGDVLLQGTVTGVDPSAGPTSVVVMVWPLEDGTAKVGGRVDTLDLPAVPVDATGHWVVELDPDTVTSRYLTADSPLLNLDVQVLNHTAGAGWSLPVSLLDDPAVWRSEGAGAADGVIDLSMDFGAKQVTLTDSLGEVTTSPLTVVAPD